MQPPTFFSPRSAGDPNESHWTFLIVGLAAVILVLAILPFVYTGTFARYQADDYCSAQLLRTDGFWGAQWVSYTGWSSRFSTMFVTGLIDPLNVVGMQILPGLLIAGLLLSAYLLLRRLGSLFGLRLNGIVFFSLAAMITFFALYTTPSQFQSYYWRSGSITYTLPIICLFILLSVLLKRRQKAGAWWQLVLITLFSFFAAGFSETNAALQTSLLVLGLIGIVWYEKKTGQRRLHRAWWIAALLGSLLAIVLMALSPGNSVRLSLMPEPPGFFRWLYLSFRFGLGFVYNGLSGTILPRTVSFLLSFALAITHNWKGMRARPVAWSLLAAPVVGYLLAAACSAPSAYAQSAYPEDRALTGANFILTAGVVLEGFLLGILYQVWRANSPKMGLRTNHTMGTIAVVLLSVYVIYAGLQILQGVPDYRARAKAWDARAAQIQQLRLAGDMSPVVAMLDSIGRITELTGDPDEWVNRCAASYYQVKEITAK